MQNLQNSYISMSKDPLIGGIAGVFGDSGHLMWFKTFIVLEAYVSVRPSILYALIFQYRLFQVPVFILGLRGLYKGKFRVLSFGLIKCLLPTGSRSIYSLLTLYGASSATTTLACLTSIIQMPSVRYVPGSNIPALDNPVGALTQQQRLMLLSSYIPFFLVALIMAMDMAMRVNNLVQKAVKVEEENKWK